MCNCTHKIMFITLSEQFKQFFSWSFDYIQYLPDVLILEMNHQVIFYSTAIPTTQMGWYEHIKRKKWQNCQHAVSSPFCWPNLNFYSWSLRQAYLNDINSHRVICSAKKMTMLMTAHRRPPEDGSLISLRNRVTLRQVVGTQDDREAEDEIVQVTAGYCLSA